MATYTRDFIVGVSSGSPCFWLDENPGILCNKCKNLQKEWETSSGKKKLVRFCEAKFAHINEKNHRKKKCNEFK
ncbi:MAG: hypothetical protein ACFFD4_07885 [Candidatus Odinarchaeota archaeon]